MSTNCFIWSYFSSYELNVIRVDLLRNQNNHLYDLILFNFLSFFCFHMIVQSKSHYCFSNHSLLALQYKNLEIYDKEITKRYVKHEIKIIQKKKQQRKRHRCGQTFHTGYKNRFLMLLIYYRLYITYTLAGFLFVWISNICRDIQKIEY